MTADNKNKLFREVSYETQTVTITKPMFRRIVDQERHITQTLLQDTKLCQMHMQMVVLHLP